MSSSEASGKYSCQLNSMKFWNCCATYEPSAAQLAKAFPRSSLLPASFRPFHPPSLSPTLPCPLPRLLAVFPTPLPLSFAVLLPLVPGADRQTWYSARRGFTSTQIWRLNPLEPQSRLETNYFKYEGFVHKTGLLCYELRAIVIFTRRYFTYILYTR